MIHLELIRRKATSTSGEFPFSVPVIASLELLELSAPVTFFVGENGSGKSTLLEAIALASNLPFVGSERGGSDPSLALQRGLADTLRLGWRQRTHRGFFLRAEDFFGFQKRLARERRELTDRLREIEVEYRDRSEHARVLARGPTTGSLAEMERRYGADPDGRSHGEAFLRLFESRLVPESLVLLDEPETPLSPQNQLGLIALMLAMVERGTQFIVATHSPIVLAVPAAKILSFDGGRIREVDYRDLEHVQLTRDFLNDPDRFLRRL
jgi:predicted ATPase